MSFRRTSRTLGIHNSTVQRKASKFARCLEDLHQNLMHQLPDRKTYLLDEEESYEQKSIRTVTLPILIEEDSWFVVATDVEPIRRLAPKGTQRRRRQEREEAKYGKRPDRSREAVTAVLTKLAKATFCKRVGLITDLKSSYATIAKRVFAERLTSHVRVSSRLPRNQFNPLFPINTTNAMTRDHLARLRRRTWCASKKRERLKSHLVLFTAYRNYVRQRFNSDERHQTPAERLGILPRNLTFDELLRWRQDWGPLSSHPMSASGTRTVRSLATPVGA
jgi:IS1 family transposase